MTPFGRIPVLSGLRGLNSLLASGELVSGSPDSRNNRRPSLHGDFNPPIDERSQIERPFGTDGNSALDAALIAAGQKVEHYEITAYGCLCTWANQLGLSEVLPLLKQNLLDEKETDHRLTELAERAANVNAASQDTAKKGETSSRAAKMVTSGP